MKKSKPIRVLTFSFFLLMIGFFVAWQSGWLGQLFVPEEEPYRTLISRIPDTVNKLPLDIFKQEVIEQQQHLQPVSMYQPTTLGPTDPLMMASSKTMVISAPSISISGSPSQIMIKSLFEQPMRKFGRNYIVAEIQYADTGIFYVPDYYCLKPDVDSPEEVYMLSTSKSTVIADPMIEFRRKIYGGIPVKSIFGPDTNTAKLKARFRKP